MMVRKNSLHRLTFSMFLALMLITVCEANEPLPEAVPRSIETIADDYVEALLLRYPSIATSYGLQGRRHNRLFDNSLPALSRWQAKENALLKELLGQDATFNGQGTLTYSNGDRYVGEWRNGKKHGKGSYTYANGTKCFGEYKNDLLNGKARCTFADGDVLEGIWKNHKFTGK